MPKLSILIINYNSPDYTAHCLQSLAVEHDDGVDFDVWLLENASSDNSEESLQNILDARQWTPWVHFIQSDTNLGFAGGNNALLERVLKTSTPPDFLLLLNNDTIVHPGCLDHVIKQLQSDPTIDLISCNLENPDGSIQNIARKIPTPLTETLSAWGLPYRFPRLFGWADLEDDGWDRAAATLREVEWIGGAFMCMPLKTAEETRLFDPDFFFYGEDIELCFRIRKRGGRIVFDPGATTTHFGGASSDSHKEQTRKQEIMHWRARLMVQQKCYGRLAAGWVHLMYLTSYRLRKSWLKLRGRRHSDAYRGIENLLDILTHLKPEETLEKS